VVPKIYTETDFSPLNRLRKKVLIYQSHKHTKSITTTATMVESSKVQKDTLNTNDKRDLTELKKVSDNLEESPAKKQKLDTDSTTTVGRITETVSDAMKSAKDTIVDAAVNTANMVKEAVEMGKEAVGLSGAENTNLSEKEIDQKAQELSDKVEDQRDRAMQGAQDAKDTLSDKAQQAKDTVSDQAQKAKETVSDTAEKVKESVAPSSSENKDSYKDVLTGDSK
jgi:hypothetical protein